MTPLALQRGDIAVSQHLIWQDVATFVAGWLPDFLLGNDGLITCHQVCASVCHYINERYKKEILIHRKGKFNHCDHSWLVFADNPEVILDPYPWASASGPLLITTTGMSPWRLLYDGKRVK